MKKFILLTTPRTGSTYIRLWLNNHPNIRCHGEIFLRKYGAMDGFKHFCNQSITKKFFYDVFCNKIFTKIPFNSFPNNITKEFFNSLYNNPDHSRPWTNMETWNNYQPRENLDMTNAVGFKLMYYQLKNYKILKFWIENNNLGIIHIRRDNILKIYLSRLLLRKRGFAHSSVKVKAVKVFVNPKTIVAYLERIDRVQENIKNLFPNNPYLEIKYEDFFSNNLETSERIWEFLGVRKYRIPAPSLKKVNYNYVEEIIGNYDKIVNALKNTPYESFLEL